jgi:hypothetical protein
MREVFVASRPGDLLPARAVHVHRVQLAVGAVNVGEDDPGGIR